MKMSKNREADAENVPSIWDYKQKDFCVLEDEARAQFESHIVDFQKSITVLAARLRQPGPFSLARISGSDALYLASRYMSKDELAEVKDSFWYSGIDSSNIPNPQEFAEVLRKADLVCCHQPISSFPYYWGPTLDALVKWDLLDKKQYLELHSIYWLVTNGILFHSLWDKKVVFVGAKAEPFYHYFFSHPHYRATFCHLGLDRIKVAGIVPTPDYNEFVMNFQQRIERMVRATYSAKPDVFLFSAGIMGSYLATMVKEDGYVGLDLDGVFDSMMNWPNKRPGMELFHQYEHPDYDFNLHSEFHTLQSVLPKVAR